MDLVIIFILLIKCNFSGHKGTCKTCKTCAQKQHLSFFLKALLRLTYITLPNLQKSCHAASVSAGRPGLAGPAAPANVLDTRERLCSHMLENSTKKELSRTLSINNSITEMCFSVCLPALFTLASVAYVMIYQTAKCHDDGRKRLQIMIN